MTYETMANIAQTWGLIMFCLSFAGVLVYTFRPNSKTQFDDAALIPFRQDGADDNPGKDRNHV